jgi:hypothetical protein
MVGTFYADSKTRPFPHLVTARFDPNVWSGRALQEGFVDLADVRSCINVSGF